MKTVSIKQGEPLVLLDPRTGKSYPVIQVPKGLRLGRPAMQVRSRPVIRKTS